MSSHRLPPERRPPTTAADAAQRLATIVDAAERAAQKVIDEAEQQARQHLEDARARADGIVAERLRELADELEAPTVREQAPLLRSVTSDDGESEQPARRSSSAGARLLATQMAVSGAGREEIEARLRSGFEIEDTAEIVDAILGPED